MSKGTAAIVLGVLGVASAVLADAVGTSFSYQGVLSENGQLVDGAAVDLRFRLFDSATGGVASPTVVQHQNILPAAGHFIVPLDFGVDQFDGEARWLEIEVATAGGGAYTTMQPRQELTPAPNAINAQRLDGLTSQDLLAQGVPVPLTLDATEPVTHVIKATNIGTSIHYAIHAVNLSPSGYGVRTESAGTGIWANSSSQSGRAGFFTAQHPNFQSDALHVVCDGNIEGRALYAVNTGAGDAAHFESQLGTAATFENTFSGNNSPVIQASTAGGGATALIIGNENDGNVAAMIVRNSTGNPPLLVSYDMLIDGNEINVDSLLGSDALYLNNHSVGDVRVADGGGDVFLAQGGGDIILASGGNVGVGIINPEIKLHVNGNENNGLTAGLRITSGAQNLIMDGNEIDSDTHLYLNHNGSSNVMLATGGGNVGIGTSNPAQKLHVNGTARVEVLEITGADLAEKFPVSEPVQPGMVVQIDTTRPGRLCIARGAYNRCVAGIVSGANDLAAGAILGHLPGQENAPAIALSGRVWVHCDGPVQVGDLLTTSDTPGHAMRVGDHSRAAGAVLGKAMTSSESPTGMVLVLVTLQ
jgi:hypothetical protein